VIHVEQDSLCALEKDSSAAKVRIVEVAPHRLCKLENELCDLGEVAFQPLPIHRWLSKAGAECIMMRTEPVKLRTKFIEVRKITHPDGSPAHLVFVGGAYAAARGPDLACARRVLAKRVEIPVDG
jgi:hypothetical protein